MISRDGSGAGDLERAEEACLDAEAWAAELEDWLRARPSDRRASEMSSIARMLRALVKSIRLSIVADESDEDRRYLVEELEATMTNAGAMASGAGPEPPNRSSRSVTPAILATGRATPTSPPPSAARTVPPPPGMSPREILERAGAADLPMTKRTPKAR